jgi:hypothetical protein
VLAVGNLHVENFGTWRDIEGRLIWGVNDFDEVYPIAYTVDLVRLATSALVAISGQHLSIQPQDACSAILEGYAQGLAAGGHPIVLAESYPWLRSIALSKLRDPVLFWNKMGSLKTVRSGIPASALDALQQLLPESRIPYRVVRRVAGLGSLGRQRFVALAVWRGGKIAREAKALAPSACLWANRGRGPRNVLYQAALDRTVRCPDPFVHLQGNWIVRRLAPDCCRIELASLPGKRDEAKLLHAMGWETANVHLGSKKSIADIKRDLKGRKLGWLGKAAIAMQKATRDDWKAWIKSS